MTDFEESTSGRLPQDELSRIARGEPLTAAEEFLRGESLATAQSVQKHVDSLSLNLARDHLDGSAAKLARDYARSSAGQLAGQFGSFADHAATAAKMSAIQNALEPPLGDAEKLAMIRPFLAQQEALGEIGGAFSIGIDPKIIAAIRGMQPVTIDPGLAGAVQHAQRQLEEAMHPLGGAAETFAKFEQQHRDAQKAMLATLAGPFGDISRTGQWASVLGAADASSVTRLFSSGVGAAIGDIKASVLGAFNGKAAIDQARMSATLGLSARLEADLASTRLKMSVIAGIGETFSLRSDLRLDAYQSLFGEWRTRPDLPEDYWRDARVRKRMYRDADVDDGLIVATPGVALEVMIESGLATGMCSESNAVAVVTFGEVSMTIRSRGTRKDTYAILERFEIELRAYVTRKLEERFGDDWFKLRASNLLGKAKGIRRAAMERREAFAPLLNFVELGDLAGLILAKQNWDEVFGEVFINRAEFDHDMQKLIAARRPTMHVRTVDAVRVVELICVVQRLSEQMTDDGAWRRQAELDH
ncbi:hypothetical protein [Sphingomonas faeni]|uniref:hypothetical protein n=1 Tax=Sphingomonas faeni TaxID=185950 RepID=UPI0027818FF2|nr:hypothetical protein [Sphingomonas faeni]MDQ0839383.1 outer membrane lipoprotein SlyB [Sphingomonas faeni]